MSSIVETILTLILTALATFIAAAELKEERRAVEKEELEKQEQDAEKAVIKELVVCAKQVDESITEFLNLQEALNGSESEERLNETAIGVGKCLDAYGVTLTNISNLYERLLVNEDKFPFSRGFERYIDAFRSFLMSEGIHRRACAAYTSFIEWAQEIHQEPHALQEKDVNEFNERINPMFNDLEELGMAVYKLYPYIREISIKYSFEETGEC